MKKIILLAIITYFLIAPVSYHPDTKLTLRYPALENNNIWDIYGYINNHKLDIPDFHYPPAHYWWLKIHYPISKVFGGKGFDEWLSEGSAQASFNPNVFRYNLATKLPLLILGLLLGWLIFLIVKKATNDENKGKIAAVFWYFNPVTLYSLVIMGQNDIIAIFLFLLGMLFYKKWWLAILFWGLASGVKSYPIIWSIIFLLAYEKNIVKLIGKAMSVVAIFGLILLPWVGKSYFTKAVLNSGLSQRIFIPNIPIGFDKQILIVPLLLIIIGLNLWKKDSKNKMASACLAIFQSCLVILGFSHFNPQWMLWIIPFLSIWLSIKGSYKDDLLPILIIFGTWIILILGFDDKFLTWGLFSPISPNLINFPTLNEFIKNKGEDFSSIINFSQSILSGVALWYISKKFTGKDCKSRNIVINNILVLIPWIGVVLIVLFLFNIKILNKNYAQSSGKEVYLSELNEKKFIYDINHNLKYFEISLINPGMDSQDKGILVVSDNYKNSLVKEFSGFNAPVNGWLRVDVPKNMSRSDVLSMEVSGIVINDGLLKIGFDQKERWMMNFYNIEKLSGISFFNKFIVLWWWWLGLVGVSFVYIKVKKD